LENEKEVSIILPSSAQTGLSEPPVETPGITKLFNVVAGIEIAVSVIIFLVSFWLMAGGTSSSEIGISLLLALGGLVSALMFYGFGFALKCLDQIAHKARTS
jgi:hypothetical protein